MSEENGHPYIDDPLIKALRRRAPTTHRKGWYSEVADGVDCDDTTVKRWFYGKARPDTDLERALFRFFGPEFADEVIHDLYGWHVVENGDAAREQRQAVREWYEAGAQHFGGNVTKLGRAG